MTGYEVIIIILGFVIVLIIRNKTKNKKDVVAFQRGAANVPEMEEQKLEVDNNWQTPNPNLDTLHWTMALMSQVKNEADLKNTPLTNEINEAINKIIAIPHDFNELGDTSMYQLVVESGYIEAHDKITKGLILDALTKQPNRTREWLQWSEDQRVTEGWFLRENSAVWRIGAFSTTDGYQETLILYPDLKSACATLIKLQLEYTKQMVDSDNKIRGKKKK